MIYDDSIYSEFIFILGIAIYLYFSKDRIDYLCDNLT